MISPDGMGAIEARLAKARLQEEAKAAQALQAQAARDANIRAQSNESAALVREFIDRATRLGIKPPGGSLRQSSRRSPRATRGCGALNQRRC